MNNYSATQMMHYEGPTIRGLEDLVFVNDDRRFITIRRKPKKVKRKSKTKNEKIR